MVNKILEPLLCNRSRHAWCDAGPHHRSDYVSTCSRVRVAHRTGHGKSGPFWWRYLADTRTLKATSGIQALRGCVSSASGADSRTVLAGGWSQCSQISGFSQHRTCHVTCSRIKGPTLVGEWLSLVEHLVRDQGVGGSNPLSPTISS